MRSDNHFGTKLVWAVDPITTSKRTFRRTVGIIRALTHGRKSEIQPVYIYNRVQRPLFSEIQIQPEKNLPSDVERKLNTLLKSVSLNGLQSPKIIFQEVPTVRAAVHTLLSHAREYKSDLIVVSTHAREGIERIALGSFAETIVLQREIPVLVIGPKTPLVKRIKHLLFPTDFTEESMENFDNVLALAKDLKLDLTIFHKPEPVFRYIAPVFSMPAGQAFQTDSWELAVANAKKWAQYAKHSGVRTNTVIEKNAESSVPIGILRHARRLSPAIIAMPSHKGAIASALLGSTIRQVIRGATVPVWILASKGKLAELKPHKLGAR